VDKFIGKTLNDRYILTEIVGVGGMAVVYKAFDQVVNRVVAVKILKEEFMSDAQFRRRFANESKAITMLSQNNIVDVYDVCLEGDLMYLVMEYIDGITLKEYLDKVKVLEWHEASFYIKQILKAMSHAHERGIVHRDLKPHNIMLLRDGTIKVTDFGIAKLTKFDTQTITDKAIGSVHYISPEQASGDRTDEKTDIYSVGVMFYEMLTGTLPFIGDTAVSVALMQVQAQPKLPREINENIPEGVEEITIKAMMKDPSSRYSSALLMFNDLVAIEENPETVFGYIYNNSDDEEFVEDMSEDIDEDSDIRIAEAPEFSHTPEYNDGLYEGENDEEEENKFKSTWLPIICGIGCALIVVFGVVFGIIYFHEIEEKVTSATKPVEKVTVENYVGQDFDTVNASNLSGLVFERENVISDQKAGIIISQDPLPDTQVDKGSVVTFSVSIGQETVSIPDLTNQHYDAAAAQLKAQGIKYTTRFISDDGIAENRVIRTNPSAGEEATPDTVVTIYISTGPAIVTKDVPDLLSNTEADAIEKLSSAGFKVDKKYQYNDSVPKDCVISQTPAAGTKLEEGSVVVIDISLGPKPDGTETNPDDGNGETDSDNNTGDDNSSENGDGNTENNPPSDGTGDNNTPGTDDGTNNGTSGETTTPGTDGNQGNNTPGTDNGTGDGSSTGGDGAGGTTTPPASGSGSETPSGSGNTGDNTNNNQSGDTGNTQA